MSSRVVNFNRLPAAWLSIIIIVSLVTTPACLDPQEGTSKDRDTQNISPDAVVDVSVTHDSLDASADDISAGDTLTFDVTSDAPTDLPADIFVDVPGDVIKTDTNEPTITTCTVTRTKLNGTDSAADVTFWTYSDGLLVSNEWGGTGSGGNTIVWTYENGRLASHTQSKFAPENTAYQWAADGRLASVTSTTESPQGLITKTNDYTYDSQGRVSSVTAPYGDKVYTYDAQGRIFSANGWERRYDDDGRLTSSALYAADGTWIEGVSYLYYGGRVQRMTWDSTLDGLERYDYLYDDAGGVEMIHFYPNSGEDPFYRTYWEPSCGFDPLTHQRCYVLNDSTHPRGCLLGLAAE